MIVLSDADQYLQKHLFSEKWTNATNKEAALNTSEMILKSAFTLRDGAEETDNYFHAVCEQAMHLLMSDKALLTLQQSGVTFYMADGMQFTMKNGMVSPVAKGFLRSIIKTRVGKII